MEFFVELNSAVTKVIYNNKYKPAYIISKEIDSVQLFDLSNNLIGKITKNGKNYKYQLANDVNGSFIVINYFRRNFVYIPSLKYTVTGSTQNYKFKFYRFNKRLATTKPVILQNGNHLSINILDANDKYLVLLLIEFLDDIGFTPKKGNRKKFLHAKKSKLIWNMKSKKLSD